ncbi:hypothetical protein H0H81_001478 [Sphagnurus paluster]|uniref:F-box domain-containing protein n=1 Tax=Sphagnurus paluster TaxID=117069 RepID=A0A9P7FML1_9AGAR|nr:hypothetical protein H0H81_001478 [Sphagnurus paluster]
MNFTSHLSQLDLQAENSSNIQNDNLNTLVKSNHHLSFAQEQSISSLLAGCSADLARTEAEMLHVQLDINRLMEQMETLSELKKKIHDDMARYRYLLAPIRLLPPEILIEIFKYAAGRETRGVYPRLNQAPISVSQACSTWRKVSFQCPTLWSNLSLSIGISSKNCYKSKAMAGILGWWYTRAEGHPLSFFFSDFLNSMRSLTNEIAKAIIPFSHRLSHLELHTVHSDDLVPFLSRRDIAMPFLETLTISTHSYSRYSPAVHVFRLAPALRDVTLGLAIHPDILARPSFFEFPWAQLTRLTISDPLTSRAFHHIIIQCHHLVNGYFKIDLELSSDLNIPQESPQPIVLAHLSTFRLQILGIDNANITVVDNALSGLSFMSLETLELCVMDMERQSPLPSTISSLHTPTSNAILITRLVLINACHDDRELSAMLRACNALETFAFQSPTFYAELLFDTLLGPTDGSPAPSLPSLTSFVLVVDYRDLEGLPERLSTLVYTWASNFMRRRPLKLIAVYDLEETDRDTDDAELAFSEMRKLLGPWTKIGDYEAVAESGMTLYTEVVYPPFDVSEELRRFQERSENL